MLIFVMFQAVLGVLCLQDVINEGTDEGVESAVLLAAMRVRIDGRLRVRPADLLGETHLIRIVPGTEFHYLLALPRGHGADFFFRICPGMLGYSIPTVRYRHGMRNNI